MNKKLYVFDHTKINDLKEDFQGRKFTSIAYLFILTSNLNGLEELDTSEVNNFNIDITSLAFEFDKRLSYENFLYKFQEYYKQAKFFINVLNKDKFLEKYPFVFDEIDESYIKKNNEEEYMSIDINSIDLYTYSQTNLELDLDIKILPIGTLFLGNDDFNLKYDIKKINKILIDKDIKYIDITEMIYKISFRPDLILFFEIMIRQIQNQSKEIKFLVSENVKSEIIKYFPFSFQFSGNLSIEQRNVEEDTQNEKKNIENITEDMISKFNIKLKGHRQFKKDFVFQLKKFILLNELNVRKIFSVFLSGESGVGKTEFAKILSEIMYPNQAIIKINFGNYSNEGVLNSLIGSPLGYIGSEEGGELINKIKNSKSKVILIDEFEKATPNVFNFFYELLEDGKFTDRHGREHDLDGYIIVFTSNVLKEDFSKLIPNSLVSRFDLVYRFVELSVQDRKEFIKEFAEELIAKMAEEKTVNLEINNIQDKLNELETYNNFRIIRRKVEDIIVDEYLSLGTKN